MKNNIANKFQPKLMTASAFLLSMAAASLLTACNNQEKIDENKANSKSYNYDLDGTWIRVSENAEGQSVYSDEFIILDSKKTTQFKRCGQELKEYDKVESQLTFAGDLAGAIKIKSSGKLEGTDDSVSYQEIKISSDDWFKGGALKLKVQNLFSLDTAYDVCATKQDSAFTVSATDTTAASSHDTVDYTFSAYDDNYYTIVVSVARDVKEQEYQAGDWTAGFDDQVVKVTVSSNEINESYQKSAQAISGSVTFKQIEDYKVVVEGDVKLSSEFGDRQVEFSADIQLLE